ncbi:MAG: hypothetical protein A07HR60_02463, partial [uncultured archaeon A07HR60]
NADGAFASLRQDESDETSEESQVAGDAEDEALVETAESSAGTTLEVETPAETTPAVQSDESDEVDDPSESDDSEEINPEDRAADAEEDDGQSGLGDFV